MGKPPAAATREWVNRRRQQDDLNSYQSLMWRHNISRCASPLTPCHGIGGLTCRLSYRLFITYVTLDSCLTNEEENRTDDQRKNGNAPNPENPSSVAE